tara:strand:+ start:220 stop:585 length:366 start_codon:yes stop_codon:yes gene_type:complete
MKPILFILIIQTLTSLSSYGQNLEEVYRSDSIHTPLELYRIDTKIIQTLSNEVLKYNELDSLHSKELILYRLSDSLYKIEVNYLKGIQKSDSEKIARNRKGFLIASIVALLEGFILVKSKK